MPKYAADFRILIAGRELDLDPRHLTDLRVEDSLGEISKCEFTISDSHDFTLTAAGLQLKMTVEVYMGYVGDLVKVFAGEIVEINPDFGESAPPVLKVVAYDPAYRLKRTVYKDRIFTLDSYYNIIRLIVSNPDVKIKQGYPFGLIMSPEKPLRDFVLKDGQDIEQNNESDMDVLSGMAERLNYNLFVKFGMGTLDPDRNYLYFVRDEYLLGLQTIKYRMLYGGWPEEYATPEDIRLLRFAPSIDQFDVRGSLEISSWITDSSDDVYAKVDAKRMLSMVIEGYKDMLEEAGKFLGQIDSKPETDYQAKELIKAKLQRMIKNLVKGDASIEGNARLQPGQKHEIVARGLGDFGKEYSGEYFVTSVTHALSDRGFTTDFNVRKMGGKS
jgi:hypothetical protein